MGDSFQLVLCALCSSSFDASAIFPPRLSSAQTVPEAEKAGVIDQLFGLENLNHLLLSCNGCELDALAAEVATAATK